jgi:hypothetical protein
MANTCSASTSEFPKTIPIATTSASHLAQMTASANTMTEKILRPPVSPHGASPQSPASLQNNEHGGSNVIPKAAQGEPFLGVTSLVFDKFFEPADIALPPLFPGWLNNLRFIFGYDRSDDKNLPGS